MKLDTKPPAPGAQPGNAFRPAQRGERVSGRAPSAAPSSSAMADAFAKLRGGR
jgi:hypothetical protein